MTIKEIKEMYANQYADIEIYRPVTPCSTNSKAFRHACEFKTDYIESVEDYDETSEVIKCELMGEEDYNCSVLADSSVPANFAEWYDNANAKVLCVLIAYPDIL